ncbi:MAG: ABC transporter permease subunit [Bifidobacteriaceae bacterium]|jgi:ABC-type transport system involved in multi-copper enzyme maturation permease subunit|nr:ABC transporter permease subunit [Bifidobacteriaceae bacterium]
MTTIATAALPTRQAGSLRVTLPHVIRSEWIKLRSLRSNLLTFPTGAAIILAMGVAYTFVFTNPAIVPQETVGDFDPVSLSLAGVMLAQLAFITLGVICATNEYSTGSIRGTFSAVPHRLPVLWAKLIVVTATTFVVALASALVAFFVGQAILSGGELTHAQITDPGVLRALVGTAGYVAGTSFLGVCAGFLIRSTAIATAVMFGVFLILDSVLSLLPQPVYHAIAPYLPPNTAASFTSLTIPDDRLPYWGGLTMFLAYLIAASVAAAVILRNRDA